MEERKESPPEGRDGSWSTGGASQRTVSHIPSREASVRTVTCVGCHDNEIETGINNSHSASSLT